MSLRVLAVSAPEWPCRAVVDQFGLNSSVPFSLQNAMRLSAGLAASGRCEWGHSNWNTLAGREASTILLRYWAEEEERFRLLLNELRPDLLLIGAMTLCLPGAVLCARAARKELGDSVAIVLGGKHVNETVQVTHGVPSCSLDDSVWSYGDGSERVTLFNAAVSGEAEDVVRAIGVAVAQTLEEAVPPTSFLTRRENEVATARGTWTLVAPCENGELKFICSSGRDLCWESMPTAPALYRPSSPFPVFESSEATWHAYSDMGRGCVYDCSFCSERFRVNGKLRHHTVGVRRLMKHFEDITARSEARGQRPSAFVEDSIFLAAQPVAMRSFAEQLDRSGMEVQFGIQLTVDTILRKEVRDVLPLLRAVGLSYVAFGMETISEKVASRMSKNRGHDTWLGRTLDAMKVLVGEGLDAGVFVLWGLGETKKERHIHLEELLKWQRTFKGQPSVVGLNWATIHPAAGPQVQPKNSYAEWGTDPQDERLPLIQSLFGEAAPNISYREMPNLHELERINADFRKLTLFNG